VARLVLADQVAVEDRADRAEALRDGEEDRDRLRLDLQREDLADHQVRRAWPVGGSDLRRWTSVQ
jgi:hypothetical protein